MYFVFFRLPSDNNVQNITANHTAVLNAHLLQMNEPLPEITSATYCDEPYCTQMSEVAGHLPVDDIVIIKTLQTVEQLFPPKGIARENLRDKSCKLQLFSEISGPKRSGVTHR